jgi:hypothetical protein
MDDESDIDIEGMRVDPEKMGGKRRGSKRTIGDFTMVPRDWVTRLLNASRVSTFKLGLELLYMHWCNNGEPIAVSNAVARAAKISDRSKWNALNELAQLNLIEIVHGSRKSPRVSLRFVKRRQKV